MRSLAKTARLMGTELMEFFQTRNNFSATQDTCCLEKWLPTIRKSFRLRKFSSKNVSFFPFFQKMVHTRDMCVLCSNLGKLLIAFNFTRYTGTFSRAWMTSHRTSMVIWYRVTAIT